MKSENNRVSLKNNWLSIVPIIISLIIFLFGTGFLLKIFYRPILTYTIIPNYDLGSQYFSGVLIENKGRQNETDINIYFSSQNSEIGSIVFPGLHEDIEIIEGGSGKNFARIVMPRFSSRKSMSIYILSTNPINLDDSNILISSNETVAQPSNSNPLVQTIVSVFLGVISSLSATFSIMSTHSLSERVKKRKESENILIRKLLNLVNDVDSTKNEVIKVKDVTKESEDEQKRLGPILLKTSGELLETICVTTDTINQMMDEIHKFLQSGDIAPEELATKLLVILKKDKKWLITNKKWLIKTREIMEEILGEGD